MEDGSNLRRIANAAGCGYIEKRRKPYVAHMSGAGSAAMLMNGATDLQVCNELGLEPEELVRLKHITGYAKLYENNSFTRAAISENQARQLQKYRKEAGTDGDC